MAVLQGITGAVRSQIAGRLNSAVSSTLRSGVGSLSGAAREGANSALNIIPSKNKFTTSVMSYPEDVANDPQAGHFILFEIFEFTQGKLKSPKVNKSFEAENRARLAELDQEDADAGTTGAPAAGTSSSSQGGNRSIIAQKAKRRLDASIALYMPPSVTVDYEVKYTDAEIGTLAMVGRDIIKAFTSGQGTSAALSKTFDSLASTGAEGLKTGALKTLDVVAPGVSALAQLETGKVVTPKMELMFEGVGRRNFSFKFDFIPKSVNESRTIENIIKTFKENMMPEFVEGSQREMKIPNTFEIRYMYQNTENQFINKISSCFLKNVQVTYGGDRYTAYDPVDGSPVPQKSSITLSFGEIEIMNKELVRQGF